MTTLRIDHRTVYRYSRPVTFGRHRLVLRPREGHEQQIVRMRLEISPRNRLTWTRDVFGNSVAFAHFLEPADRLEIRSDVVLHREVPFPAEEPHEPWTVPMPVLYDRLESVVTDAYLLPSYPDDAAAVRQWMDREMPAPDKADAEAVLLALGSIIHQRIRYNRRPEKGVQTPAETLKLHSGSCRDMATLLMDAARQLGIAARFVSGYLDCPASLAGRASTHAWIEYYLPLLGWRGFDPTIGEPTSLKHVVVGVSNHPRGVMPISGVFGGTSAVFLGLTVSVQTSAPLDRVAE